MREGGKNHKNNGYPGLRLILLLCGLLCGAQAVVADTGAVVLQGSGPVVLGGDLQVLITAEAEHPPRRVLEAGRRGELRPVERGSPHFGYGPETVWGYLAVERGPGAADEWVVEVPHPLLGFIEARVFVDDREVGHFRGGKSVPRAQWPIGHYQFSFPLVLEPGQRAELLFRMRSASSLQLPVEARDRAQFSRDARDAYVGLSLFFGLLGALLFYNLLLYAALRDINSLYYVLYLGCFLVFVLNITGFGYQFLWPGFPGWAQLATPILGGLVHIAALLFTSSFLHLRERMPWGNRWFHALNLGFLLVIAWALLVGPHRAYEMTASLAVVTTLSVVVVAMLSLRRGLEQARYFLLAWVFLLAGVLLYALRALGVLPNVFITEFGVQIGAAMEMLLLSLALAHRMRLLEDEKQRVEREGKAMLEERVRERTRRLDEALGELGDANRVLAGKTRLFEKLVEANSRARETHDVDRMLERVMPLLAELLPECGVGVMTRERQRGGLIHHAHFRNLELADEQALVQWLREQRRCPEGEDAVALPGGYRSVLSFPMDNRLTSLEGVLVIAGAGPPGRDARQAGALFSDHVAAALQALLLELELERIANTDALTGVFNRNYVEPLLDKAIADKQRHGVRDFALLVIDLDGLKQVNDEHGHEAGDALIRAAAERIGECCRATDVVARWGGDEFLVFCPDTDAGGVEQLLHRMRAGDGAHLSEVETASGERFNLVLRYSIGGASSDEQDPEAVLGEADRRMYEDKVARSRRSEDPPGN